MPANWEYVLAAYAIWGVTFLAYILYLAHRFREAGKALRRLSISTGTAHPESSSTPD